jgi:hypothetical protein
MNLPDTDLLKLVLFPKEKMKESGQENHRVGNLCNMESALRGDPGFLQNNFSGRK